MEDSLAVANEFIRQAVAANISLSPMKLQKLIYLAHGWRLAIKNEPLVDETFQAWDYGPVLPSVYHEFKCFGKSPVDLEARRAYVCNGENIILPIRLTEEGEEDVRELVRKILDVYGDWTPNELSSDSHVVGGPWDRARKRHGEKKRGVVIPDSDIQDYFNAMINKNTM